MIIKQNFGQALEAMKEHSLVARESWITKGAALMLKGGHANVERNIESNSFIDGLPGRVFTNDRKGEAIIFPEILKSDYVYGPWNKWNPSYIDMLAEDWCILD